MHILQYQASSNATANLEDLKVVNGTRAELIAWIVLIVWPAHFGIPLLIGTVLLSKNVHRLPTFVNMCIVWILNGIWSCFLVYPGYDTGPEPPKPLCLAQAALLNGNFPAASLSVFFLVLQVFLSLKSALRKDASQFLNPIYKWIMLFTPYASIIVAAVITTKMGIDNPKLISRRESFFYCSVHSRTLNSGVILFSSAVLVVTLVFEVWTLIIIARHGRVLWAGPGNGGASIDRAFIIRIAVFTGYVLLGLCLSITVGILGESAALQMVFQSFAWALCFVFGSQRDFLKAWAFWRREDVMQSTQVNGVS